VDKNVWILQTYNNNLKFDLEIKKKLLMNLNDILQVGLLFVTLYVYNLMWPFRIKAIEQPRYQAVVQWPPKKKNFTAVWRAGTYIKFQLTELYITNLSP
jgi:hypothetical protein